MNSYLPSQKATHRLRKHRNVRMAPDDPQAIRVCLLPGGYNTIYVHLAPDDPQAIPICLAPQAYDAVPICFS